MKIRGTDFVMYLVSDLARAASFYRDVLGLPQNGYSEEWKWAEFDCGNVTLALKAGEKLPEVITGVRIALAVDDILGDSVLPGFVVARFPAADAPPLRPQRTGWAEVAWQGESHRLSGTANAASGGKSSRITMS
jgi:catechol 2,3-dioxygenase-like lactoylglutathione lyase family enzyme